MTMDKKVKYQRRALCTVYILAMFMAALDGTIVYIALPSIAAELGVTSAQLSGLTVWYLVGVSMILPCAGYLGDRFGSKKMFMVSSLVFTFASYMCALADSVSMLNIARFLQGLGGGLFAPIGMAMIFRTFSIEERPKLSRSFVIPIAIAPALGPIIGGVIVTYLPWQWIFLINIPIGLFIVIIGALFLQEKHEYMGKKLDVKGLLLLVIGFPLFMYTLNRLTAGMSLPIIVFGMIGLIMIVTYVFHALKADQPLLNLKLLEEKTFKRISMLSFLGAAGLQGFLYLFPIMYQYTTGASPLKSGLTIFIEAIGLMVASRVMPLTLKLLGVYRVIVYGFLLSSVFFLLISWIGPTGSIIGLQICLFGIGLTLGHAVIAMQYTAFHHINKEKMSQATTLFNVQNRLGAAMGIVSISLIISMFSIGNEQLYQVAIIFCAMLLLAACLFAINSQTAIKSTSPKMKKAS
ncbi:MULTISPECIES: DHA2 family efflux MFS transporter permease subunit [Cytobacillus]|uniref:DHA2 family efflux MFS transporter permease subunit n=1 Tax=Cytobacillus TaxID=2675230 RepID=UPI0024812741|nr:DHA2 family efflux MFS transporter permease subunit [Cytobacillus kochii]